MAKCKHLSYLSNLIACATLFMLCCSLHVCVLKIINNFLKKQVVKSFVSHAEGFGLCSFGQCSEAIEGF